MPRKPNIPFGDKRRADLNRINRNIENKQKNLEKRFGMRADFQKKSAADFSSVKEFNDYLKQAQHFTKRTANKFDLVTKEGKHLSFLPLSKVEKEIKRINSIKDKEFAKLKDLQHMELGRKTGLTIGESVNKKIGFSDPKFEHFKHVEFRPQHFEGDKDMALTLHKLKARHPKDFIEDAHQMYFENFLMSLKTTFNKSSHPLFYSLSDDIWAIHDKVLDMGVDAFMNMYYQGTIPTIAFIYGKDMEETKLAELRNAFGLEE